MSVFILVLVCLYKVCVCVRACVFVSWSGKVGRCSNRTEPTRSCERLCRELAVDTEGQGTRERACGHWGVEGCWRGGPVVLERGQGLH